MMKSIIKHLIYGIAGGCVLFVLCILVWDLTDSDRLYEFLDNFTIYALGFIVIASGFSMSSMVYDTDRLALWLKISINLFVGLGIFFLVGSTIGIISLESPTHIAHYVATAALFFIAACLVDYLLNGREAKKINAKLREQKARENVAK